jgi:hypothetical protein
MFDEKECKESLLEKYKWKAYVGNEKDIAW